jgi:ABC transporter substrate binding protein
MTVAVGTIWCNISISFCTSSAPKLVTPVVLPPGRLRLTTSPSPTGSAAVVVFLGVSDPIGSGFAANLARPGSNLTGIMLYEEGVVGKWLAMLKEIAPRLARVALVAGPRTTAYDYFVRNAEAAGSSLDLEIVPTPVAGATDIERGIEAFSRAPNGGLLLPSDGTTIVHRDLVIHLLDRAGRRIHVGAPQLGDQQQVTAAEHVERQIAVAVVVAVEEPPLLLAVQWIIRCIEIEDDLLGRPRVRLHEQVDQQVLFASLGRNRRKQAETPLKSSADQDPGGPGGATGDGDLLLAV